MLTHVLSRRTMLGGFGLVALGGLVGCGDDSSTSGGSSKVTFQMSWTQSVQFGGTYLAKDRGLFKKLGLDVTAVRLSNPVAGVDVDKAEDHALAEWILAGRG